MRHSNHSRRLRLAALLAGVVFAGGCAGGTRPAASAERPREAKADGLLARTPAFEFHGAFWTDLHHFLYVVARSRLKTPDTIREAVVDAPEELEKTAFSPAEREAMESALAIYGKSFAKRDLVFDDGAARESAAVARLESRPSIAGAETSLDPELARALERAAPAWRRAFWPRHSQRNRAWLDEVLPILAKHSKAMVDGIENAYGVRWPAEPLRVDLVAHANWAGAYTVASPPRTTMSTTDPAYAGTGALEMLFHEASHTFDSQIDKLLLDEGRRQARRIPPRLEHAIIFDTAGELAAARVPGYVPVGEKGLYARGEWFREPLTRIWHPMSRGRWRSRTRCEIWWRRSSGGRVGRATKPASLSS